MDIKNGLLYNVESCKFIIDLIPPSNATSRPGYHMIPTGITIHNPGNAHRADQITKYVDDTKNTVSWHFSIGKGVVYQELPINENAWHAGDGKNGIGNRYTISCEIEENEEATQTAIAFLSELTECMGWKGDKDIFFTHQHWSGKFCPRYLMSDWDEFVDKIVNHGTHWADKLYDFYNKYIGTMHDKRFDAPLTRGESLALKVGEYKKIHGMED